MVCFDNFLEATFDASTSKNLPFISSKKPTMYAFVLNYIHLFSLGPILRIQLLI